MSDPIRIFVITFDSEQQWYRCNVEICDDVPSIGRQVAAHKRIEAVRLCIPTTHVKSKHPVEAPVVEVWVDKRFADEPRPKRKGDDFGGDKFVCV